MRIAKIFTARPQHSDGSKSGNFKLLRGNPGVLTAALFASLLVYPFFAESNLAGFVRNAFYSIILVSAIWALHERHTLWIIGCLLGLPWIVLSWSVYFINTGWFMSLEMGPVMSMLRLTSHVAFLGFVTFILLGSILHGDRVTNGTLCHAVSVYILIGLLWAAGYALVYQFDANAFAGNLRGDTIGVTWNNCIYFSFSTMTTVGFGDIVPVSTHAKSLATVEMIVGPLYLIILVARLVGLYKNQKNEPDPSTGR